jgi:hypothetical protein
MKTSIKIFLLFKFMKSMLRATAATLNASVYMYQPRVTVQLLLSEYQLLKHNCLVNKMVILNLKLKNIHSYLLQYITIRVYTLSQTQHDLCMYSSVIYNSL